MYKYNASVGYILFDEIRCYELESASGDTVEVTSAFGAERTSKINLCTNGTFETDISGWTGTQGTLALASGGVNGGNCLAITGTSGGFCYPWMTVVTTMGKRYKFSAWVRRDAAPTTGYLSFWWVSNPTQEISPTFTTTTTWQKIEFDFTSRGQDRIAMLVWTSTGVTYWDEVELYESDYPTQYAPYSVGTLNSEAKAFRAINISQSSEQRAKITAIEYDADVYADDEEVAVPDIGDTWVEPVAIKPVTDLILMEIASVGTSDGIGARNIFVSFKKPENDFNYRTARIWYKFNKIDEEDSDDAWALLQETSGTSAIITNVIPNYRYTVCVTSVSKDNIESLWDESPKASCVMSDINLRKNMVYDLKVSGLQIVGNPNSITFMGNDCSISWNPTIILSGNNIAGGVANSSSLMESGIAFTTSGEDSLVAASYKMNPSSVTGVGSRFYQSPNAKGAGVSIPQSWFKDYEVKVYSYNTGALLRTEYITDNFYTYTYDKNYIDSASQLNKKFQIEVKARDINLNSSLPVSLVTYNPNITTGSAAGIIHIRDVKAQGTNGGASAVAWTVRDINTEVTDTRNNCTISANRFTLDAGTYEISVHAPIYDSGSARLKLYNQTDGSDVILGPNTDMYGADGNVSTLMGIFTIATSKAFEIQHYASSARANVGFGNAVNVAGVSEIYTDVYMRKIA